MLFIHSLLNIPWILKGTASNFPLSSSEFNDLRPIKL